MADDPIEVLPYHQVSYKASHNSFDWHVPDAEGPCRIVDGRCTAHEVRHRAQIDTVLRQLAGDGLSEPCLGIELDVHRDEARYEWTVRHYAHQCGPDLRDMMQAVAAWSDENAGHPVVTLHVDLKDDRGTVAGFADAFDALMEQYLGEGIYRPAAVIGAEEDLVRGARAGNWASFGQLRGRFVLCLTGAARRKRDYARHDPGQRACFADRAGSGGPRRSGARVFANCFSDAPGYRFTLQE